MGLLKNKMPQSLPSFLQSLLSFIKSSMILNRHHRVSIVRFFLKKLMMVFIPCNALGGKFSWICAPLAPPQGGLILVTPCPSGFMLHLVHFKPFIFRTQERVTCLHTSKKSSCLQFKRGGERVHQRSRWQLCVCVLLTIVGSLVSKTLKKR
jgi:hypothetical protein